MLSEGKKNKDLLVFLVSGLGITVFILAMTIYGKNKDIAKLLAQLEDKKE
ncbi:hypothetical protein [endosymbiont 'TC1' of Trimyema compressum]|nr:hypothetical protein [endosymbiont 'TC1' of Trimyema compressum]